MCNIMYVFRVSCVGLNLFHDRLKTTLRSQLATLHEPDVNTIYTYVYVHHTSCVELWCDALQGLPTTDRMEIIATTVAATKT